MIRDCISAKGPLVQPSGNADFMSSTSSEDTTYAEIGFNMFKHGLIAVFSSNAV